MKNPQNPEDEKREEKASGNAESPTMSFFAEESTETPMPITLDNFTSDQSPGPAVYDSIGSTQEVSNATPNKIGNYEILAEIGAGGMGRVYKARHTQLDRILALKVMISAGTPGKKESKRFLEEAKLCARLSHDNIVKVYDSGIVDGHNYIVMDYIEGRTLTDMLKEGRASLRKSLQVMVQVLGAMDFAHKSGVIHRDLKPSNIMLEKKTGRPLVMDFGLAKDINVSKDLTKSGEILGTPHYMAPEQAQGRKRNLSNRTDIYALGAILYEMLTGTPPVQGATPMLVLYNLLHKPVVPPRERNPRIAVDLETICLKALAKDPENRYETAADFSRDLESFLSGETIQARRQSRGVGNILQKYSYVVIAVLLLAVIAFFLFWNSQISERERILVKKNERRIQFSQGQIQSFFKVSEMQNTDETKKPFWEVSAEEQQRRNDFLQKYIAAKGAILTEIAIPGSKKEYWQEQLRRVEVAMAKNSLNWHNLLISKMAIAEASSSVETDVLDTWQQQWREQQQEQIAAAEKLAIPEPTKEELAKKKKKENHAKEMEMLKRGSAFHNQKDFASAIQIYEEIITQFPNSHRAYFGIGYSYNLWGTNSEEPQRSELLEKSIDNLTLAILHKPKNMQYRDMRINTLLHLGRREEALDKIQRILEEQPNNLNIRYKRASIYHNAGNFQQALKEYTFILEKQPKNHQVHTSVGILYYAQGLQEPKIRAQMYQKAIEFYTTALEHSPSHQDALNRRAELFIYFGKYLEATKDFSMLIEQNSPKSFLFQGRRGYTWYRMGKKDQAIQDLRAAIQLAPANNLSFRAWAEAIILESQGKIQDAWNSFARSIKLEENPFKVYFQDHGRYLQTKKERRRIVSYYYKKYFQAFPKDEFVQEIRQYFKK